MDFNFPIVKKVFGGTMADKIISVLPMTLQEAARGRKIKPYPAKYDSFASVEDFENYIENFLHENKDLKAEWLKIGRSAMLPFNLRDDVYYTSYEVISITCHRPPDNPFDDIIYGKTVCELNPVDPIAIEAHKIIDKFKI